MMGVPAYSMHHPRRYALLLLNNLLGGDSLNSRLNAALRERRGLVYHVESNVTLYSDTGLFAVYFAGDPQQQERCIRLVRKEVNRLLENELTERQLMVAKRQWKGQLELRRNRSRTTPWLWRNGSCIPEATDRWMRYSPVSIPLRQKSSVRWLRICLQPNLSYCLTSSCCLTCSCGEMRLFEQFDSVSCSIVSFEAVSLKPTIEIINLMNESMKKMRLTAVVVMLTIVTAVSAQVSLGIKGGVNMSNLVYDDEVDDKNPKIGFNIGLAADVDFAPNVALQTGLFFNTKGFKSVNDAIEAEYTENLMYLQLPLHLAYKVDVTPGTRVVFHAGPYAAYGVGGSRKAKVGNLSGTWDVDKIFGDAAGQYKPFDAGLGLGVGAEMGVFLIDLGWDMGLVNISNRDNGNTKNQNAYLSVGYRF